MIATRSIAEMLSGGGRYALDVPVAALAGLSVAFLAFAAPPDLLADMVGSLGLSSIIPGAEPPLGMKARIGLGAAGAVAVFGIAFLLLRWLDRIGSAAPAPRFEETSDPDAPRLRRRDLHPDAPPRPPIMATWELGEPEPAPPRPARRERAPLARFPLDPPAPAPAAEPEPAAAPQPVSVPVVEAPPAPTPVVEAPPEPLSVAEAPPAPVERPSRPAADVPDRAAAKAAPEDRSLPELMARLEEGLARRRQAAPPPAEPAVAAAPLNEPDDRLQNAIESLQRLASRQT